MAKTIQLKTDADKKAAVEAIVELDLSKGAKEVLVRDSKISLSTSQRNLYWMWVDIVSVTHGESKAEVYFRHKKDHLVKIFRRDDPDFEAMYDPLNTLYKVDRDKAMQLVNKIVDLMSISEASTKQMAEFMAQVQMSEALNGCSLPDPDKTAQPPAPPQADEFLKWREEHRAKVAAIGLLKKKT